VRLGAKGLEDMGCADRGLEGEREGVAEGTRDCGGDCGGDMIDRVSPVEASWSEGLTSARHCRTILPKTSNWCENACWRKQVKR
jgi:hypothetical protein